MDTTIAKGIAITLMLIHHLFAFPDRLKYDYISIFTLFNGRGELNLGYFSNICVACYMFLSGYGLYKSNKQNCTSIIEKTLNHLKRLMLNYWVVFSIFISIGLIFFPYIDIFKNNSTMIFVQNFIGISNSYNGEWWFLYEYIILMLVFPIIFRSLQKNTLITLMVSLFLAYSFNIQKNYYSVLYWQLPFIMGMFFSKHNVFSRLKKNYDFMRMNNVMLDLIIIALLFIFCMRSNFTESFNMYILITPLFLLHSINLAKRIKLNRLFNYLGKHSTNMWLTHTFFCYYYFQKLVFIPRVSILILIWLIILTVSSSIIINKINSFLVIIISKVKVSSNNYVTNKS